MKYADSFSYKYATRISMTSEKVNKYKTPEETAVIEQAVERLERACSEDEIPKSELEEIKQKILDIRRNIRRNGNA